MKLYRFSPIENIDQLLQAIKHIHRESHILCRQSFGDYLPNAGNVGVFCHFDSEYEILIKLRDELTEKSDNFHQKYFRLKQPVIIPAEGDMPETTYAYLYIRRPDPYRAQVGDIDFYLEQSAYNQLKKSMETDRAIPGARIFDRPDLDMIELHHPDIDVLAYVSTHKMTEKVRTKQSEVTKL